jgi:hypothetical protein
MMMMMMVRVGAHAVVDDVVDLNDGLDLGVDDEGLRVVFKHW